MDINDKVFIVTGAASPGRRHGTHAGERWRPRQVADMQDAKGEAAVARDIGGTFVQSVT